MTGFVDVPSMPPRPSPMAPTPAMPMQAGAGRIYWLDILGNGVFTALADGSSPMRVASALASPDGVVVDPCSGVLFFTNMGSGLGGSGQASVQRWDGTNVTTVIAPGSGINTAKQLAIDVGRGELYIADREGAKVWRASTGGGDLTTMVSGHDLQQVVGIALDLERDHIYFTDRIGRRVLRMGRELPAGSTAADRTDVETLFQAPAGAMPIDLALDLGTRLLYMTDRQLGTVQRMGMDPPAGESPSARSDLEIVLDGLTEPIGVAIDGASVYVTELSGSVHRAHLDGGADQVIAKSGSATGIALSDSEELLPSMPCE